MIFYLELCFCVQRGGLAVSPGSVDSGCEAPLHRVEELALRHVVRGAAEAPACCSEERRQSPHHHEAADMATSTTHAMQ